MYSLRATRASVLIWILRTTEIYNGSQREWYIYIYIYKYVSLEREGEREREREREREGEGEGEGEGEREREIKRERDRERELERDKERERDRGGYRIVGREEVYIDINIEIFMIICNIFIHHKYVRIR